MLALESLGLAYLAVASWTDIRTREVPDWLNYSLIAAALGARGILSAYTGKAEIITEGLAGFAVFLAISLLLFYSGQWGGGDAKLLMGMGALIGFDFSATSKLADFFILLLVAGAVYGILWTLALGTRNPKIVRKKIKSIRKEKRTRKITKGILGLAAVLVLAALLSSSTKARASLAAASLLSILTLYAWQFVTAVEKACMYKRIPPERLTEGDWVAEEIKHNGRTIYSPKELGIGEKQIRTLISMKRRGLIKRVLVKEGVPFVPSFFLAYLLALLLKEPLVAILLRLSA